MIYVRKGNLLEETSFISIEQLDVDLYQVYYLSRQYNQRVPIKAYKQLNSAVKYLNKIHDELKEKGYVVVQCD